VYGAGSVRQDRVRGRGQLLAAVPLQVIKDNPLRRSSLRRPLYEPPNGVLRRDRSRWTRCGEVVISEGIAENSYNSRTGGTVGRSGCRHTASGWHETFTSVGSVRARKASLCGHQDYSVVCNEGRSDSSECLGLPVPAVLPIQPLTFLFGSFRDVLGRGARRGEASPFKLRGGNLFVAGIDPK
jgi:hypothetical protein